jgi:hypothetical protein
LLALFSIQSSFDNAVVVANACAYCAYCLYGLQRSLAVDRRRQRMITGGNEDNGVVRFWDLGRWRRRQQQQSGGSIDAVAIDRTDSLCGQAMEGAHSDYVSGVALCGLECWVSASLDGTLCAWTLDGNGAR